MRLKSKVFLTALLVICVFAVTGFFHGRTELYCRYIYYPAQTWRAGLLQYIPFSIGDVLYFIAGLWLLVKVVQCIYYLLHFRMCRNELISTLYTLINVVISAYLLFLLGWGVNYYKQPLVRSWALADTSMHRPLRKDTIAYRQWRTKDSISLVAFDSFLVNRLNAYAPQYQHMAYKDINAKAISYYYTYTDSRVSLHGLDIKPTLYHTYLELTAVDGYYNPFTGEGQINDHLPGFVLPFIICHEMAHQAGIAAEGDANLLAYAVGTVTNDPSFRYSAYLNIWLYAHNRLVRMDSALANTLERQLNPLTTAHLDTLEQISNQYNDLLTFLSGNIYDTYLKMNDQKEGMRSYGNVSSWALLLEQKRRTATEKIIRIPEH